MKVKLVSRKSNLALYQTRRAASAIEETHPDISTEIITKDTIGDQIKDTSIPDIGGKGLFTAALEKALLVEEVDCAVHSLKDLPTELPDNLEFGGALRRGNPADAFVSNKWHSLDDVPAGATIATGSRRREGLLSELVGDVNVVNLRGNIETRLEKLRQNDWDGIIMAAIALERLDLEDKIAASLDPTTFVPAVSQGAIGLEIKQSRDDIRKILDDVTDTETNTAVRAERAFLRKLEGGCSVPIGGYCHRTEDNWRFHGWLGRLDGTEVLRDQRTGSAPVEMAEGIAEQFLSSGAEQILSDIRDDETDS